MGHASRVGFSIALATLSTAMAGACSTPYGTTSAPGAADAEPDTSLDGGTSDAFAGLEGSVDAPATDPCRLRAIALGAAQDASVFCERFEADAGASFFQAPTGTTRASSDAQGPYVTIVGDGSYSREVPATALRVLLAFRVRVRSVGGSTPYVNVAGLQVTTTSTSKTLPYFPRVLVQGTSSEIGGEALADGGAYVPSSSLVSSAASWSTYVVRYDVKAGSVSLSTAVSAPVKLPFLLQGAATKIVVQAGAIGGDHEVDLADLLLAVE